MYIKDIYYIKGKGERASGVVRAREYPLSSVRFLQELGEGAFGKLAQ
jgi:hypothetical protein